MINGFHFTVKEMREYIALLSDDTPLWLAYGKSFRPIEWISLLEIGGIESLIVHDEER